MYQRVRRWPKDEVERLESIKHYILTHLHEELQLSTLAGVAAMNEKKLNAGFTHFFKMKVTPFILESRMQKARSLLLTTDETTKKIADICGYKGLSSFYRAFKTFYGYTPVSLRNL